MKEINLEKSEQNLLNKVSSEDENDDYGDSKQIVIDKSDIVKSEGGQEVETAPKNDNDIDHLIADTSIPCNSESLSDLERDLEPTIQTTISQETLENCSVTNNEASGHRELSQADMKMGLGKLLLSVKIFCRTLVLNDQRSLKSLNICSCLDLL